MEKTIEFEARPKIWGFWNWRVRPTPSPRFIEIPASVPVTAGETYRVTLAPVESEPLCPPLCPICGKPASEHCWGLFCCPHCTGEAGVRHTEDSFGHDHAWVQCSGCPAQTKPLGTAAEAAKAWNRRT